MKLETTKSLIEPACKNNVLLLPGLVIFFLCCYGCTGLKQSNMQPAAGSLMPDALDIINQALADADPAVRVAAIETVATTGRIEFMPKVQTLLADPFVPVRFAATLAVADTGFVIAEKKVKMLLDDPDQNVGIAAAYCLYKFHNDSKYLEPIKKALLSPQQTIRANAAVLLGKSGDKTSIETLYKTINDPKSDDKVRFQAAEAVASLGDERIYPKLWAMLISVYADDRVMGIRAMAQLGTPQAKNALITMLDDPVAEVRLAAAERLGSLGDKIGEPEVLKVLQDDSKNQLGEKDRERLYVLAALAVGQIRTNQLVSFLPAIIKDNSKMVALAAAKADFQLQMTE